MTLDGSHSGITALDHRGLLVGSVQARIGYRRVHAPENGTREPTLPVWWVPWLAAVPPLVPRLAMRLAVRPSVREQGSLYGRLDSRADVEVRRTDHGRTSENKMTCVLERASDSP